MPLHWPIPVCVLMRQLGRNELLDLQVRESHGWDVAADANSTLVAQTITYRPSAPLLK